MDFYKLSDFQLYSIINSRHLDAVEKAAAEKELERRRLTPEKLQQFAEELASRQHEPKWSGGRVSPTILWLVVLMLMLIFLRQSSCH